MGAQAGYGWLTTVLVFLSLISSLLALSLVIFTRRKILAIEENLGETVDDLISEVKHVSETAKNSAASSAESERAARRLARTCMNSLDLLSKELHENARDLTAKDSSPNSERGES